MRIMTPERTINGKSVGIIRSNHKFNPFKEKERHDEGKVKIIAVSINADIV